MTTTTADHTADGRLVCCCCWLTSFPIRLNILTLLKREAIPGKRTVRGMGNTGPRGRRSDNGKVQWGIYSTTADLCRMQTD